MKSRTSEKEVFLEIPDPDPYMMNTDPQSSKNDKEDWLLQNFENL